MVQNCKLKRKKQQAMLTKGFIWAQTENIEEARQCLAICRFSQPPSNKKPFF